MYHIFSFKIFYSIQKIKISNSIYIYEDKPVAVWSLQLAMLNKFQTT
jgi:hypothetical protein